MILEAYHINKCTHNHLRGIQDLQLKSHFPEFSQNNLRPKKFQNIFRVPRSSGDHREFIVLKL